MTGEQRDRLNRAKHEFVTAVLESINRLPREQAEQRVCYLVTGVWNELEREVIQLPARKEKAKV